MNDLPGYHVDQVLGEVTGLTVRSRNVGVQIGAELQGARWAVSSGPDRPS